MPDKFTIGITCYPTIGGSGIVATELGHELGKRGHQVHFVSYDPPFRIDLTEPNIFFHKVSLNEYSLFKYPDYTLPLSVKMNEVHQRYGLDILHVHYAVPHATAALLARQIALFRGNRAPRVITTLHGTDITLMGMDPNLQPIIEYSIDSSCGATAVSENLKQQTNKLFAIEKDIRVIYNFYNPKEPTRTRAEIRRELGVGADDTLVIHLSNLRPVKRIPDLIRAAAQIKAGIPVKFLIIAGGNFEAYLPLLHEFNLTAKFVVKQNVADIENYLQAADIGFFPSEDESFGMGILEAMNFGHPVVATRAGGIPEVMEDGKTGYLHAVGDIDAMARSIERLAHDKKLRDELGGHASRRAWQYFSAEKIVNEYVSYYQEILGEKDRKEC